MGRFGLIVLRPNRKTPEVRIINAINAAVAKRKFLGTAFHERTEASVLQATKLSKNQILEITRAKRK